MTETLFEALSLDRRVDEYGTLHYYNALGQRHRVHGPAIERPDGYRVWFQNGRLHRLDGPAVEYSNGTRIWYHKGQRHRIDGPAIECPNGYRAWYINGEHLTQAEWQQVVTSMESV